MNRHKRNMSVKDEIMKKRIKNENIKDMDGEEQFISKDEQNNVILKSSFCNQTNAIVIDDYVDPWHGDKSFLEQKILLQEDIENEPIISLNSDDQTKEDIYNNDMFDDVSLHTTFAIHDKSLQSFPNIIPDSLVSTNSTDQNFQYEDYSNMNRDIDDNLYFEVMYSNKNPENVGNKYHGLNLCSEFNNIDDKSNGDQCNELVVIGNDAMLTEVSCITPSKTPTPCENSILENSIPIIHSSLFKKVSLLESTLDFEESTMSCMIDNALLSTSMMERNILGMDSSHYGMQVSPQYLICNSSREEASSIGEASPSRSDPDIYKISQMDSVFNKNLSNIFLSALSSADDENESTVEKTDNNFVSNYHNGRNIFNLFSSDMRSNSDCTKNRELFSDSSINKTCANHNLSYRISLSNTVKDIHAIEKLEALLWRLFRNVFPGVYKRTKSKTRFVHVENLIDLIIKLTKNPEMTISLPPISCLFQSHVVLCKFPSDCLKHIRRKVLKMIFCLLPSLQPSFAHSEGEVIDRLLDLVVKCNNCSC